MLEKFNRVSTSKFLFATTDFDILNLQHQSSINYIFAKNGLFLSFITKSFIYLHKIPQIQYYYFGKDLVELQHNKFVYLMPKFSINIIKEIIDIFSQYDNEVYCALYFDTVKLKYIIYFPEQMCSKAYIEYKKDSKYDLNSKQYYKCVDFHSHPFSSKCKHTGHHVHHSHTDKNDSFVNMCPSCVIDPKSTLGLSTYKFEIFVPNIDLSKVVSEDNFIKYEHEDYILDFDKNRIVQKTYKVQKQPFMLDKKKYDEFDEFDDFKQGYGGIF